MAISFEKAESEYYKHFDPYADAEDVHTICPNCGYEDYEDGWEEIGCHYCGYGSDKDE